MRPGRMLGSRLGGQVGLIRVGRCYGLQGSILLSCLSIHEGANGGEPDCPYARRRCEWLSVCTGMMCIMMMMAKLNRIFWRGPKCILTGTADGTRPGTRRWTRLSCAGTGSTGFRWFSMWYGSRCILYVVMLVDVRLIMLGIMLTRSRVVQISWMGI